MRIDTLAFWSESGVGREAWLAEFRQLLQKEDIPFRDDDGWRWFDLELQPARWLSHSLVTVTEYHGGQRWLTRIGVQLRVRYRPMALLAAVWLLVLCNPLGCSSTMLIGTAIVATTCLLVCWTTSLRKLHDHVHTAAQCAGLKPFKV